MQGAICYRMISVHLEEVDHQEKLLQRSFFWGTQGANRCKVCGFLHIPPLKVSPCFILSQEMFSKRMQHLNVCCERCKSSFISREYFKRVQCQSQEVHVMESCSYEIHSQTAPWSPDWANFLITMTSFLKNLSLPLKYHLTTVDKLVILWSIVGWKEPSTKCFVNVVSIGVAQKLIQSMVSMLKHVPSSLGLVHGIHAVAATKSYSSKKQAVTLTCS